MIKQTRGALNFLIASYKAILKHAVVVTTFASVSAFSSVNAATYNLGSDTQYYKLDRDSYWKEIADDNDGSDTIINNDPYYGDVREINFIRNYQGNMKFTNGGNLSVIGGIYLFGESFNASNTYIIANYIQDSSSSTSSKPIIFGDLRLRLWGVVQGSPLKADSLTLDRQSVSYLKSVETKDLYIGHPESYDVSNDTNIVPTKAYIINLKADNIRYSSEFGASQVIGVISNLDNNEVNNLSVGPNSFLMIGLEPKNQQDYQYVEDTMDRIGLNKDPETDGGFNSILYLYGDKGIKIKNGGGITVDGNVATPKVESNTVTLGDYSAIVLSKQLSENALVSGNNIPAISFADGVSGIVKYAEHSRILLDSTSIKAGSSYNIFGKHYAVPTNGYTGALIVESVNGNFKAYLPPVGYGVGGNNYNTVEGEPSSDVVYVPGSLPSDAGVSRPNAGNNGNAGNAGTTTPSTPDNGNKPGNSGNTTMPSLPGLPGTGTIYETFTRGDYTNLGNTLYGLLHNTIKDANAKGTGSEFLSAVAGETFTGGKEAEQAARLGQLGGVYQSAFTVSSITDDIVSSRNGVGSSTGSLIVSDNNNGFGIWLSPMVKVASSDGFDSDGLSYGTRVRLTDFAIGADYTLNNGSRVGAYFNTGNGKSTGKGLASHTDGDLKYYGAGLYVKYSYNDFSLLADVSYNKITDDVDTDLGL